MSPSFSEAHLSRIRDVSVILPCYKAASLAKQSVTVLECSLQQEKLDWEVIVVDDGGGDFQSSEWSGNERIRLLQLPNNRGKGAAVRSGMLLSQSSIRIFTDVDLPYGTHLIPVMASYLRNGFHVVIGDRTLPGSKYADSISPIRRLASSVFTGMVGTLVTGGFFDTQCGLKAVRGDVADALFPLLQLDRFAFDVELLYVALKNQLDIKRIPVCLLHNETSSVRLFRDSIRGAIDVMRIKANQLGGAYQSLALEQIVIDEFDAMRAARSVPR